MSDTIRMEITAYQDGKPVLATLYDGDYVFRESWHKANLEYLKVLLTSCNYAKEAAQ
jgi:hypothetical protein